jgi:LPS-assembly lipoprotein
MNTMRTALLALILALTMALSGCGFQLRGQADLPFNTVYAPGTSPLVVELRRNIVAGTHTKLLAAPENAQAIFGLTQEVREKVILSFNTAGLVREYQLRYRIGFRVHDVKGRDYIPASEIQLTRDISFNEGQILAKESEEALLYRDMQSDMVQQIIRRMAAAKLRPAEE